MFEILSGGLLGSLFGGLFRLAPEVLKFLDKGNERKHELSMFTLQTDLEKMRGQFKMEERYVDYSVNQLDAIKEAFKEQAQTAKEAGRFVAAVSALVRPGITWRCSSCTPRSRRLQSTWRSRLAGTGLR